MLEKKKYKYKIFNTDEETYALLKNISVKYGKVAGINLKMNRVVSWLIHEITLNNPELFKKMAYEIRETSRRKKIDYLIRKYKVT